MAAVDGLLKMVAQNSADELRLKTDASPQIFSRNAPIRLSIPATPEMMMRHLLEGVLTPAIEAELNARGKSETTYLTKEGESYAAHFSGRSTGGFAIEVSFRRGKGDDKRASAPHASQSATAPRTIDSAVAQRESVAPRENVHASPLSALPVAANLLQKLLHRATGLRASDVHLLTGEPISIRVDGLLRVLDDERVGEVEALFAELVSADDIANLSQQSKDFAFDVPALGRFRVNLYRVAGRVAAAIRLLPEKAPSLGALNLPVPLHELTEFRDGLVIVCGPTGAGKSATLAALAEEALRRRSGVLITLEDPIEYPIRAPGAAIVRQRQVGTDVASFPNGLRDALREDPDIILVGEMRDPDTIRLALTAAETGHLVLASLHSRSAPTSVERIIDSYAAEQQQQIRVQLADSLRAVISQRLVPRANGNGRIPAIELMRGTHTVANLIREAKTAQLTTVLQSGKKEGMLPLERCLADLVASGQITLKDANAAANSPGMLATYLQT